MSTELRPCSRPLTLIIHSTHILEYSLVIAPVISLGHLSTTDLAASTLASLTANVTGFSIIIGMVSALDSLLPQAWTSGNPKLVGLWSQRMMIVLFFCLFVRNTSIFVSFLGAVMLNLPSRRLTAYAFGLVQCRGTTPSPQAEPRCRSAGRTLSQVAVDRPSRLRL